MKPEMSFIEANGQRYLLVDGKDAKIVRSKKYNYNFDKRTGFFARWGKTLNDDPQFAPAGPEILDIEITTGFCPDACKFCYKGNTPAPGHNMTFAEFKTILDKMPKTLTQIAFGITGPESNPDFIRMMEYAREVGVIPNFTLSGTGLTDEFAEKSSKLIGAVAVSAYQKDKNVCYNAVKKYVDLGITQTNIHLMVSQETLSFVYEVLNDRMTDPRLQDMNAIVFLGVKPKGRAASGYHTLSLKQYQELIAFCFDNDLAIGFDSCSAPKFEAAVKADESLSPERKKQLIQCSESCESSAFSSYINVLGEYWNCSFCEDEPGWEPVNVLEAKDFLKDVWYSEPIKKFRERLLASEIDNCRRCIVFPEINPEHEDKDIHLPVMGE